MPEIQPFRGIRYDLGQVGSLSDVVAPPYDVISPEEQNRLYERHPTNVVRLILNRVEPGDDPLVDPYRRAGQFFRDWQRQGVLFTEPDPALYVYEQEFSYQGETYRRRGFLARVRLEPFGQGDIYPHEETMPGPKADRLRLMQAARANLSPVFGMYPDPEGRSTELLDRAVSGRTPLVAQDDLGVVHRLWPVVDPDLIASLAAVPSAQAVFIADGHHRYETACEYRRLLEAEQGPLPPQHPANYVLMMLVSMHDPGMVVFPTHRVMSRPQQLTAAELERQLASCFQITGRYQGLERIEEAWQELLTAPEDQVPLAFYTRADDAWLVVQLTTQGRERMEQLAPEAAPAWRRLGVSVLQRLVIEDLLHLPEKPPTTYVHQLQEVQQEMSSAREGWAALVLPPGMDAIREISQAGGRMPPKSTYFYPKLLSGLVFHSLESN